MYAHDTLVPQSTRRRHEAGNKRRTHNGRRNGQVPHRALNFEKYAADGNYFVNAVADELDCDRNRAARTLRAVLHAIRDRIPPDDAVQFAQGLPMAIKGVYFDQYDLSAAPVNIRHPAEFIDYVRYKAGQTGWIDFPDHTDVEDGIAAVFRVLEQTMDYHQVEQVKHTFNDELAYLLY